MGLFGYSLPPGCGRLPGEEPEMPCEVCGQFSETCICPECPVCGVQGDPKCYTDHGLSVTPEQQAAKTASEKAWEAAAEADAKFWRDFEKVKMDEPPEEN